MARPDDSRDRRGVSNGKVDMAFSGIKAMIQSGRIGPGAKLPKEAELSAELGVSRNSLREAVRAMQAMHILEARQGDGTYVSDLNPANLMDVLSIALEVSDVQTIVWYLRIRCTLEVEAVRNAAARRSETQLQRLSDINEQILSEDDSERIMQLDSQFHDCIAEIDGNPVQAAFLRVVSAPTVRARVWRLKMEGEGLHRMRREHRDILEAIRSRDVDRAAHCMWLHVDGVVRWVSDHRDSFSNR